MLYELVKATVEINVVRRSGRIMWLIQKGEEYHNWLWYGEMCLCITAHKEKSMLSEIRKSMNHRLRYRYQFVHLAN